MPTSVVPDEWDLCLRRVASLERQGDDLARPRRVDHWVFFSSAANRDAFVAAAESLAFVLADAGDDGGEARLHWANICRTDTVRLEVIHAVVMRLRELAAEHDGEYDGWGTSVAKSLAT